MIRRFLLTAVVFSLFSTTAVASVDLAARPLDEYVRSIQLPDGAFADSNAANASHITPYKGAYAAIGLALAGDAPPALAFARWYVAHMNPDDRWGPGCTIYDYTFTRDPYASKATRNAGAMDAPAGVFLSALRALYETGDAKARAWLAGQEGNAQCIARAAYGLYQPAYNCTQAIVGYNFCLTEDNFEVWRGLRDVAWLEGNLWKNSSMQATYESEESSIGTGLDAMWDPQNQNYNWARSILNGSFSRSAWTQFYPGSVTQLWPVIVGYLLPSDPRSIALWRGFREAWPEMAVRSPVDSPWPWTAVAAAKMGDSQFVQSYVSCLNGDYAAKGYPYGWESNDGGNMLTALIYSDQFKQHHQRGMRRRGLRAFSCWNRY